MCGRTACTLAPDDVVGACTYRDKGGKKKRPSWKDPPGGQKYWTSHNIAPASHTPVMVSSKQLNGSKMESSADRVVTPMKWGLTPAWHKGDPYKIPYETNNCRIEGMLEKKSYKVPLEKGNRCVVLADGYFEWKTTKEGKQPYFFYFPQPDDIKFPMSTIKAEKDLKEEKKIAPDTHFDQAIKKEIREVDNGKGDSNTGLQDTKIKSESKPDVDMKVEQDLKAENKNIADINIKKEVLASPSKESEKDGLCAESHSASHTCKTETVKSENNNNDDDDDDEIPEWQGQRLLTMAGVYDVWKPPDGSPPLYSYSIITVPASSTVDWCHHRMPAILSTEEEIQDWLDSADIPLNKAASLIKPQEGLKFHPVSKAMNSSRFKSPDCVKPIELDKPKPNPSSNMMLNWLKSGSPAKKQKTQ